MQKLLSLIEPARAGYENLLDNNVWIFNTGALSHMTDNLSFLKNIASITSIPVKLPDGAFRVVKVQGNVDL